MSIITLDKSGRFTLPRELRERLKVKRFLVYIMKNEVHMIPLPEPEVFKGVLKIPANKRARRKG
jgi:bifunctional DNA-binding transcriptional regulator/antitoxin component of YhaV-PrlF toxin-antitoxin module